MVYRIIDKKITFKCMSARNKSVCETLSLHGSVGMVGDMIVCTCNLEDNILFPRMSETIRWSSSRCAPGTVFMQLLYQIKDTTDIYITDRSVPLLSSNKDEVIVLTL